MMVSTFQTSSTSAFSKPLVMSKLPMHDMSASSSGEEDSPRHSPSYPAHDPTTHPASPTTATKAKESVFRMDSILRDGGGRDSVSSTHSDSDRGSPAADRPSTPTHIPVHRSSFSMDEILKKHDSASTHRIMAQMPPVPAAHYGLAAPEDGWQAACAPPALSWVSAPRFPPSTSKLFILVIF